MADEMDELRQTFFTECSELLVDMEERLLKLQEGVFDKEQLNAIFRCAHSIKGGSGAFGMDRIMQFTHTQEALLDLMREGKMLPSREVIDILLKSADIVNQMLDSAKAGQEAQAGLENGVANALQSFINGTPAHAVAMPIAAQPEAPPAEETIYEISFAPYRGLFSSGNEPLLILRELSQMGQAEITADISAVPDLAQLMTDDCFLKWEIKLQAKAGIEQVTEVFEFVNDIADVKITPVSQPVTLIEKATEVFAEGANKIQEVQDKLVVPVAAPASVPQKTEEVNKAAPSAAPASIRVDLEKVDRLVNMVGELVITEAMLKAQARHLGTEEFSGLFRGIEELSHHTRELQEAVMAIRMQPVKSIFSRMPRIVRDTSAQLGKDIQLILSGENTEVDKTVIEQLGDPLTHMIRNSVDHGIESPDQRVWNDKPLQGTIHLSAYHRSGRIIIEIQDDGAGINRTKVLAKAVEKGLVPADAKLTDEEIDHLIFLPGFSTAEKVTSVSGRGVGMDVVKRNIEGIGGTVHVTNNPGKGSTFTVSLPLTLAILDGMIVRVGSENYIVPIISIIETMRPTSDQVKNVQGRGEVINVRGEFVPLIHLSSVFGVNGSEKDYSKVLIVLVESGRQKMGLVVDELIGQQQVVIKSLEANADPVRGISGATILGDGKVSLILEINELMNMRNHNVIYLKTNAA